LDLLAIMLVDVHHERADGPMPAEPPDLVEAEPRALSELRGVRDGGVTQGVRPEMRASGTGGDSRWSGLVQSSLICSPPFLASV
jgi:hypothetical protein